MLSGFVGTDIEEAHFASAQAIQVDVSGGDQQDQKDALEPFF